jgi:hypothetical protein
MSELLEHTLIGTTLDLSSHGSATMLRHAADAFDELLGGRAGSVEDEAEGERGHSQGTPSFFGESCEEVRQEAERRATAARGPMSV